jgi:hypothetical protein
LEIVVLGLILVVMAPKRPRLVGSGSSAPPSLDENDVVGNGVERFVNEDDEGDDSEDE